MSVRQKRARTAAHCFHDIGGRQNVGQGLEPPGQDAHGIVDATQQAGEGAEEPHQRVAPLVHHDKTGSDYAQAAFA